MIEAARKEHGHECYYELNSPATSERIRMACVDPIVEHCFKEGKSDALRFQAKGTF